MFPLNFHSVLLFAAAETSTKPITWFFEQCDIFGKCITILLVGCSIVSIATMVQKFSELSAMRKKNMAFSRNLDDADSIIALNIPKHNAEGYGPYKYLASEALHAYQKHRSKALGSASIALCMGHVESAIQRGLASQLIRYERRLILLTSLVSGGPFLGLLGTVYGVMIAFGGLSDRATISQLAPGVAGALITTTCGLLVAIPATFGYNFLLTQTKLMTTELENYASNLADRIELELQEILRHNENISAGMTPPARPNFQSQSQPRTQISSGANETSFDDFDPPARNNGTGGDIGN